MLLRVLNEQPYLDDMRLDLALIMYTNKYMFKICKLYYVYSI